MTDTADQEGGPKFESLVTALALYFGKPIDQIPEDLRRRIIRQLIVAPVWDTLSEDQQRSAATQWDMQHDPALEDEGHQAWNLAVQLHDMKASDPRGLPSEIEVKGRRIAELESELINQRPTTAAIAPLADPPLKEAPNAAAREAREHGGEAIVRVEPSPLEPRSDESPQDFVTRTRPLGLALEDIAAAVDGNIRWGRLTRQKLGELIPHKDGIAVSPAGAIKQGKSLRAKARARAKASFGIA